MNIPIAVDGIAPRCSSVRRSCGHTDLVVGSVATKVQAKCTRPMLPIR